MRVAFCGHRFFSLVSMLKCGGELNDDLRLIAYSVRLKLVSSELTQLLPRALSVIMEIRDMFSDVWVILFTRHETTHCPYVARVEHI